MIWTLILKYQISRSEYGDEANAAPKRALLEWANSVLNPQGVYVKDFTGSWQDGAGFCGLVNAIEPGSINLAELNKDEPEERLKNMNKAFELGEGKFGIAHLLDAEDVQGSPDELSVMSYVSLYRAYLASVQPDASKCTAEGPGLVGGKTREKCPFKVITRNEEGELITRGGAKIVATLVGPDGKETKAIIKDQLNGTYEGHYEVRQPGKYELNILVVGKPCQDSPFHPEIRPSGPHSTTSYADGPGVEKAVSGEETHFTIHSIDEGGQAITEGGHIFPASFIDAASGETLPINVVDQSNGKYHATYTPKTAGNATVIVLLKTDDGEGHIKGSPYAVLVVPGDLAVDNASITGQGLERVVAGEVGEFFVQAKDANLNPITNGDHKLDATFSGVEDVPVDVTNNNDGTYKGAFTPTKVGDYTLAVVFDGDKKLPGAPFKVIVVPAASSAENTVATGSGLNKAEAGVPGHFDVEVRDKFDNPVGKGGDNITAVIIPNAEGSSAPVAANVTDNGDGTYKVDYEALPKAGDYTVEVKLAQQGIKDAPFPLVVGASTKGSDPEKSFVVGLKDAIAGEQQKPVVHSVDEFGNPIVGGGDNVEVEIDGPADVGVSVVDNGDGTYTADFTPTKVGDYTARVKINGKELKDSPFKFSVSPAAVSPGNCVASGPGISRGKADKAAPFTVQLRDQFDNDIKENPGSVCESAIILSEKRHAHEYPDSSDDESEKPEAVAEDPRTVVNMADNSNGTFGGAYTLKAAGNYILEVTVDGAAIKDAPFNVKGNPGRPHIPNSVVRGARKGKAGVDGARVILKDAQGNPRHKGGQKVHAKLEARRDPDVIEAIDNGDGSYTIPYPADAKGKYGMNVYCGDEQIPGAFGLDVSETPLTEEESAAIAEALPESGETVAALLKKAPLEERQKLAAELKALTDENAALKAQLAASGSAPAPAAHHHHHHEEPAHVEAPAHHEEPAHVEEPVAEEPAHVEEPVAEEPAHVEEPVAEEPAYVEEPVAEESSAPAEEELVPQAEEAQIAHVEESAPEEPAPVAPVAEEPAPVEEAASPRSDSEKKGKKKSSKSLKAEAVEAAPAPVAEPSETKKSKSKSKKKKK